MSQDSQSDSNIHQQQPLVNMDHVKIGETTMMETLAVIREEQGSPTASLHTLSSKATAENIGKDLLKCNCRKDAVKTVKTVKTHAKDEKIKPEEIEKLLKEKEIQLRTEYDKILEREKTLLKERFDYILLNEQTRSSFMLREAHRERQEKITALQSQLECQNLAALMYVMCTERTRSKLEKLRIIKDYTTYIHELQDILTEGQELILHLSRGYKTAARVDHEWREKMKKVVGEFMSFIYHFAGGSPESNQYFFDLPALLKTEAPIVDNPEENPCEEEEKEMKGTEEMPSGLLREKTWWEMLDGENRPFVVYGDLADRIPSERREILKTIKARKTAPKKWTQYAFNDMFLKSTCGHLAQLKEIHPLMLRSPGKWECAYTPMPNAEAKEKSDSKQSLISGPRKVHGQSFDFRGNMGSLLKMITSTQMNSTPTLTTKTALLGARDSMEISSTTKLRERTSVRLSQENQETAEPKEVVLVIGKKRPSVFEAPLPSERDEEVEEEEAPITNLHLEDQADSASIIGSIHIDSLQVLQNHVPQVYHVGDKEHMINYERVCPMEECKRMQVDSFMRSLPPYMRANPFMHFEQTFEQYETCTPEQLEMLKARIEHKKVKDDEGYETGVESPLLEWIGRGVAVQTSEQSVSLSLPPCTCHVPSPTPVSSNYVFNLEDLMPVKLAMDAIHKECLYDQRIEFDRFKLIGHDSPHTLPEKKEFKQARRNEIVNILNKHPSLLDIFQANTHG